MEPNGPAQPAPHDSALHAHASATPVRAGLGLLLPLLSIVTLLLLLLGGMAAGLRWLVVTDNGSAWLLGRLPFVQLKGFSGALLGDHWRADSLRVAWDGGKQWVLVEGLAADGLRWQWQPNPAAWVGVQAQALSARKLTLHTVAGGGAPPQLPAQLAPPVQLALAELRVDEVLIDELAPLRRLGARNVVLDARPGARHGIEALAVEGMGLQIEGGLAIANAQPYALAAHAALRPALQGDAPAWAAVVQAAGTLAELELQATLRGRPVAGRDAPALDLHVGLRPLQAWVLAHLDARTQRLDLSALLPQAPATRLTGQAKLEGGANDTPLSATLALENDIPGRWNERRLPLRKLALEARGQRSAPARLDITHFDMTLADATRTAGRWSGSAVWLAHTLTLDTQLADVTPQRLDSRAAAMTLSGQVAATLRGLPSPDTQHPTPTPAPAITWKLDLQGQLDATPQPVQLLLEGSADDQRLELTRARAQAGKASAELRALVAHTGRNEWQVTSTGKVNDFDPLPWWPGETGTVWRKGPHRLSGDWQFDVRLPGNAERLSPLELAQRVAGNGNLLIHDSLLAGVPMSADIALGYTQAAAPTPASLRAEILLGGNQLRVDGRGDPGGNGDSDRWRIEVKAETLNALAPLAQLHPALADWVPRQGSATVTLAADGRWPNMRSDGSARLSQLAMGPLTLARGNATWRMTTWQDQAQSLQIDLAGISWGQQRADNLRAEVRGTLAEHTIDISGAMPLKPSALAEQMLGIEAQSGTRAQMQAKGAWLPDATVGGGLWRAHIDRVVVGSWDGGTASGPPASGWAESRDLQAELLFDATGQLLTLQADAGRLRLADTVSLRWDEVRLDWRGAQPQLKLHADIEPFALAPLLARAQPAMGWQGDLRLTARVDIRAAEKMDADLVFERADGDLQVVSADSTQALGLSEVRLAMSAHEGIWMFTPVFRGRSLGEIAGQVRVQTTPERRWPEPAAPITGIVRASVKDIGIWGAWVPPGWRLAGQIDTTAALGGTFGAPLPTGELKGTGLAVRNLLQGVNVNDGQVAVKLAGDKAEIERFTLRGGDGTVTITGSAALGRAPQARLQLKAERFRVLGRVDRQVIASGNADLDWQPEQTRLTGKLKVDEAMIDFTRSDAPTLDDDVTVKRPGVADDLPADTSAPKARRDFAMELELDLGDKLHVRGRGLDSYLGGAVRLTTPGGRLAVNGTINAERGTYAAYGQKLEIERGIIAFSGPVDNPRLDVLALRPNIDTRVGVWITGNLQLLRVRLYSQPELSDADKLSWLVLGRASDGLGRSDTAMLQRAALALLAGEGEAPTDALMKSLGIDEVTLRQSEGDTRETVVAVGKQLSRRWYIGYERGVNATTGTFQLVYRIAQSFTLRAQSGLENALDVIWTLRFQQTPADAAMRKSSITPP